MIASKLKQAWICLRAGRVTLLYPFQPAPPAEDFRGRLKIDVEKCIGCGGCAEVCPSRLITITDPCQEKRILEYHLPRCVFCGRCAEVCPEDAITLTRDFENATDTTDDLYIRSEILMGTCQRCGRCYRAPNVLDRLSETGFQRPEAVEEAA